MIPNKKEFEQIPRIRASLSIPGMDFPQELDWMRRAFAFSKRHVEVGTFGGKSLWVSTELMLDAEVYAVDKMTPGLIVPDVDWLRNVLKETIRVMRKENPTLHVTYIEADSVLAAKQIEGLVDSVYIDADHRYEGVKTDIETWLPRVRPGGIIAGHDFWPGHFPGVIRAVQEAFEMSKVHRPPDTRIWWVRVPHDLNGAP